MANANGIYLSVVSDDFGMCPPVNDGIVQAFVEGLLTDANLMAPCPAFSDATQLARTHPRHVHRGVGSSSLETTDGVAIDDRR
jgi:predicted glycoside hydrolase/deacetylase ChbG (UPF0249 family)